MTDAEARIAASLAPEQWKQLKRELRAQFEGMASLHIDIEETINTFTAQRITNDIAVKVLRVQFDPAVPVIRWECTNPFAKSGVIHVAVVGMTAVFVVNGANTLMHDIIFTLARCLTGQ